MFSATLTCNCLGLQDYTLLYLQIHWLALFPQLLYNRVNITYDACWCIFAICWVNIICGLIGCFWSCMLSWPSGYSMKSVDAKFRPSYSIDFNSTWNSEIKPPQNPSISSAGLCHNAFNHSFSPWKLTLEASERHCWEILNSWDVFSHQKEALVDQDLKENGKISSSPRKRKVTKSKYGKSRQTQCNLYISLSLSLWLSPFLMHFLDSSLLLGPAKKQVLFVSPHFFHQKFRQAESRNAFLAEASTPELIKQAVAVWEAQKKLVSPNSNGGIPSLKPV